MQQAYALKNNTWIRLLIGMLPIVCAVLSILLTWFGGKKYRDRMRGISYQRVR